MKKLLASLLVLSITNSFFAQDTIYFQNKFSQAVKVIEIGIDEVKYNRFENLTGPLYVANKNDIYAIKFSNGQIDTFKIHAVSAPEPTSFTIISSASPYNGKIEIKGSKLIYMDKGLGEARLFRVINNVPNTEKKTILLKEYGKMKDYKRNQYLFGFVGLGVGVALPYVGLMGTLLSGNEDALIVGFASGLTIGITGAVISAINKHKRTKKRIEIANIYNN